MKDKYNTEEYIIEEEKFYKSSSLRNESELFNDDDYIPHTVISVKRIQFSNTEDWEIKTDKKTVLILKGVRFTSKEKDFFRTVEGVKYIITGYKNGWRSVSDFKKNLKGFL